MITSRLTLNSKLPLKYTLDLKILLAAALYYLAARLGYFLAFQDSTALPVWPPSGVAFALVILLGRSSWPGITIGALITNLMAFWNNQGLDQQSIITISCFIAIGQTLEVLTGNYLVNTWIKDRFPFTRAIDSFRFLFVTLFMCLVGASISTLSLFVNNVVGVNDLLDSGFVWWVSSVVGILLFTPFILALSQSKEYSFKPERIVEIAVFTGFMVGIYLLLRIETFNTTLLRSLPYFVIASLLWLTFRFNLLATIAFALFASMLFLYFTTLGLGPFIMENSGDTMLLLQIFIALISISTIILSSTVSERIEAQNKLKAFNSNLETMVQNRTKELNDEINIRKEAEDKLVYSNKELSKRNIELDNFVYSVSHDLRAPIASVLGLINLAMKDKEIEMVRTYLEKIGGSAIQLDNFIKEILDQSRNSRLDVKKEEILFEPLIDETFNQLRFATSTGVAVEKIVTIKQDGPFCSDRWRLKVILNNIISNSIRYRNGKNPIIKINVAVGGKKVILEVEDNGRGIAQEHLDKVYQMFYRATDDGAGSGLGLYIVKETIDKLRGSIDITSKEGKGTKIKLEIPELV